VRGNGKVIQEFEAAFRGAGWNVLKVIWGEDWDPLLKRDTSGLLQKRMGEVVDGNGRPTSPRTAPTSARISSENIRSARPGLTPQR